MQYGDDKATAMATTVGVVRPIPRLGLSCALYRTHTDPRHARSLSHSAPCSSSTARSRSEALSRRRARRSGALCSLPSRRPASARSSGVSRARGACSRRSSRRCTARAGLSRRDGLATRSEGGRGERRRRAVFSPAATAILVSPWLQGSTASIDGLRRAACVPRRRKVLERTCSRSRAQGWPGRRRLRSLECSNAVQELHR